MCVRFCWWLLLFLCGSTICSGHDRGGWRCRLNLSMFLLTVSVGRFWSVQSVLEFCATKKNLRIISNIERVYWTVLFRMASRVFVFFTPRDSSLMRNWLVCREPRTPVVKLGWEAFQPLFSRWLRWLMKPRWELYLSFFSCSFFSAQSSFVSMALVYSKNTHNFFSLSKARPSGLRAINVSMSVSPFEPYSSICPNSFGSCIPLRPAQQTRSACNNTSTYNKMHQDAMIQVALVCNQEA